MGPLSAGNDRSGEGLDRLFTAAHGQNVECSQRHDRLHDHRYYAKRCFLALGEALGKNMILLKDEAFDDILNFFDAAAQVRTLPYGDSQCMWLPRLVDFTPQSSSTSSVCVSRFRLLNTTTGAE